MAVEMAVEIAPKPRVGVSLKADQVSGEGALIGRRLQRGRTVC